MECTMMYSGRKADKRIKFLRWLGALFLFCFFLAIFILHRKFDISSHIDSENIRSTVIVIRAWADRIGIWGPAMFVVLGSGAFLITVPAVLIIYTSVILFGYTTGGIVSILSILGGTSMIFLVGQILGRPFILQLFGNRFSKIEKRFLSRELLNVIYLRLLFFMSPWLNWILSVTGVRYRNVVFGTLIGNAHNVLLNVWLGGLVVSLIQSGHSLNPIKSPVLLVPMLIGGAIFIVVRILDTIYQKRMKTGGPKYETLRKF